MKPHQQLIDTAELPGTSERFDQSQAAAEILVQVAHQAIGLDHFALPDDSPAIAARNVGRGAPSRATHRAIRSSANGIRQARRVD